MKPHHDFTAERALAQHCSELFADHGEQDSKERLIEDLAVLVSERVTLALPAQLRAMLPGRKPEVALGEASTHSLSTLKRKIGVGKVNYAAKTGDSWCLVSLERECAARLADRLFGGSGEYDAAKSDAPLPLSAAIALEQVARAFAQSASAVSLASGSVAISQSSDIARLVAITRGEQALCWDVSISQPGREDWSARLALLANQEWTEQEATGTGQDLPNSSDWNEQALRSPFDALPLTMRAVLAETQLPISRIASLAAGDVLPLAPRREIPLRIGSATVAHGKIGTLDESVALQLTRIS